MRWMLIAGMSMVLAGADSGADLVEVAAMPGKGPVKMMLNPETPALVEAPVEIHLQEGMNRLRFDWSQERIDMGTVQLRLAPLQDLEAEIISTVRLQRAPKTIYFHVRSSAEGPVRAAVTYLLSGLGWKVHYLGLLNEGEDRLDLGMSVELTNQSGMDLEGAEARLDMGSLPLFDLRHGSSLRLEMLRAAAVPVEKRYTFDPSRFQNKVAVHLAFKNDEASSLGRMALPSGKIRVFKEPPGEEGAALLGEDLLPFTAVDEEGEIYIGNAGDVTVERKVLKSVRENERRDRWNKVVAFDQRDRLRFEIANHRDEKLTLKIVERIPDTWEMAEKGREFERKDASTIEFPIPLAEKGKETFELEYVRRDLW